MKVCKLKTKAKPAMTDYFPSYRTKSECESELKSAGKNKKQDGVEVFRSENDDGQVEKSSDGDKKVLENAEIVAATAGGGGKQKKKKMKKKKSHGSSGVSTMLDDEEDDELSSPQPPLGAFSSNRNGVYKESTSIDSGIESDNCRPLTDEAFLAFLGSGHDDFLEPSVRYLCPKFTLNRVDNVLAFTLHAKNVAGTSIGTQVLPAINAARVKFATATPKVQNYAFFVKMPHSSNNNTAIISEAVAESWDNNVVFQVGRSPWTFF